MKYIVLIGALALILAVVFFAWSRLNVSSALSCIEKNPHPTIIAFGDSLVAGYGAPDGKGFVEQLSQKIGVPIQNFGVSGNTTADGLSRIDTVLEAKPDAVILLLGGNDALQRVPQSDTQANLDVILSKLTAAHIRVVLVGVQGAFLQDPYAPMFSSLANKYHTEFVPNILSGILGHSDLMSDEVHPNSLGYAKIAERLQGAVEKACAKQLAL